MLRPEPRGGYRLGPSQHRDHFPVVPLRHVAAIGAHQPESGRQGDDPDRPHEQVRPETSAPGRWFVRGYLLGDCHTGQHEVGSLQRKSGSWAERDFLFAASAAWMIREVRRLVLACGEESPLGGSSLSWRCQKEKQSKAAVL